MTVQAKALWNALRPGEIATDAPMRRDATLQFIGSIRTPWSDPYTCPKWGDEAEGPVCWIELDRHWEPALKGLLPKDRLQVLYWLHLSRRDLLHQSPRSDGATLGTFATPALAFRESRHTAATGYRNRIKQDTERING